ncbi:Conserved hypothetical protein [Prochlorococcus marinus str. MIT 9515]|uniref:Uncharacterized protein n=1 Tax=Prochlorococcus marinus (strain MIT 9515) TaxID=167542 RepID=A2BWI6_PROM5|nr:Conserved hypothetical protein [Prochlorococcus marinus str. MIT 9515]
MNLKERGVTVGDLLIVSVIIISTIFFINRAEYSDDQSHLYLNISETSKNNIS